jgi:DNA-binding XRE family transcriptional regulator
LKLDPRKVLRARELLGYGTALAAKEAGVSEMSYLRAEHGEKIHPSTARKVAAGLCLRVADLYPALEGETAPKAPAQPSPEQERRLREVHRTFGPIARGIERQCERFEDSGSVEGFVAFVKDFRDLIGLALVNELWALEDALDLAPRAGRRVLSGVSEEKVHASIDASFAEHSFMLGAKNALLKTGSELAERADLGEEDRRRLAQTLTGSVA